ncbi:hypothetical protein WN944_010975 [Citrus x changshan-huyou]|uniref:Uncharacterized protein n=1 Tax=Citrus x changshan-huyou TaxID=2935761 RepID=A0AAP0R134_9ROSI
MSGEVDIASVEGGWAGAMSEYRMLHVVIFRLSWIVVIEGAEAEAIKLGILTINGNHDKLEVNGIEGVDRAAASTEMQSVRWLSVRVTGEAEEIADDSEGYS